MNKPTIKISMCIFALLLPYVAFSQTKYIDIPRAHRALSEMSMSRVNVTDNNYGKTLKTFRLNQNYPNPFNPITKLSFTVNATEFVKMYVYDVLGRRIKLLINGELSPGNYTVSFDGSSLPSGIYLYSLESKYRKDVRRMSLVK